MSHFVLEHLNTNSADSFPALTGTVVFALVVTRLTLEVDAVAFESCFCTTCGGDVILVFLVVDNHFSYVIGVERYDKQMVAETCGILLAAG